MSSAEEPSGGGENAKDSKKEKLKSAGKTDKKAKKGKHTKPEKKDKHAKKAKSRKAKKSEGRGEKKDKPRRADVREKKRKRSGSASSSESSQSHAASSSSSAAVHFYRGRPCTLVALSYETDPPHAVVRTTDGREFGVEMHQLSKEPQASQRKKKKKQRRRDRAEAETAPVVVTIDESLSSPSPQPPDVGQGASENISGGREFEEGRAAAEAAECLKEGHEAARVPMPETEGREKGEAMAAQACQVEAKGANQAEEEDSRGAAVQQEELEPEQSAADCETKACGTAPEKGKEANGSQQGKQPVLGAHSHGGQGAVEIAASQSPEGATSPSAQQLGPMGPPPRERAASGPGEARSGGSAAGMERRLAESALYQEDVLEHGHREVWGSWFDVATQRWGYRCCRSFARGDDCSLASTVVRDQPEAEAGAADGPDTAIAVATGVSGLRPREAFVDAVDFVIQWVRAVLFEWRDGLRNSSPQVLAHDRFSTWEQLGEAERAVAPLLRLLEACSSSFSLGETVQVWSVGNNKWMSGKVIEVLAAEVVVTGSRTTADGNRMPAGSVLVSFSGGESRKWVAAGQTGTLLRKAHRMELSRQAIEKLESIAALSVEREYNAANQAYIELTVGNGRWHGDLSISGLTGCNKAPRNGFKVKQDRSSFLDTEEAKVYMFCLKRLVAFLQLIRPNPDVSKHFT